MVKLDPDSDMRHPDSRMIVAIEREQAVLVDRESIDLDNAAFALKVIQKSVQVIATHSQDLGVGDRCVGKQGLIRLGRQDRKVILLAVENVPLGKLELQLDRILLDPLDHWIQDLGRNEKLGQGYVRFVLGDCPTWQRSL